MRPLCLLAALALLTPHAESQCTLEKFISLGGAADDGFGMNPVLAPIAWLLVPTRMMPSELTLVRLMSSGGMRQGSGRKRLN